MLNPKLEYNSVGLESMFASDHVGPFYLTNSLLDNVKASKEGRVVIAGSIIHEMLRGVYDIDDYFDAKLDTYKFGLGYVEYAKSKIC